MSKSRPSSPTPLDYSSREAASARDAVRRRARHFAGWCLWLCLAAAICIAVAAIFLTGPSFWTALLVLSVTACLAVMLWGYLLGTRPLPIPIGPVPETRGITLGWLAPYYDGLCKAFGVGSSFRDRTLAIAGLRRGDSVLDVGCGTGVLTRHAAALVRPDGSACGIDPAPDMIRTAWQNAALDGSTARFALAAIEKIPFDSDSVDVALISFVLHCLPDDIKRSGLRQVRRVLRPGGRILAVDLDRPEGLMPKLLARLVLRHSYMAAHLEGRTPELLRDAGFVRITKAATWRGLVAFWIAEKPA